MASAKRLDPLAALNAALKREPRYTEAEALEMGYLSVTEYASKMRLSPANAGRILLRGYTAGLLERLPLTRNGAFAYRVKQ